MWGTNAHGDHVETKGRELSKRSINSVFFIPVRCLYVMFRRYLIRVGHEGNTISPLLECIMCGRPYWAAVANMAHVKEFTACS